MGHVLVGGGQAVAHVHHHDDAVGGVDGDLGLLAHVGQNALGGLGLDAAGIHQQELVAAPLAVGEDAVAGDARGILHDGQTLAAELIEQGGLAHVGIARQGHDAVIGPLTPEHQGGVRRPGAGGGAGQSHRASPRYTPPASRPRRAMTAPRIR